MLAVAFGICGFAPWAAARDLPRILITWQARKREAPTTPAPTKKPASWADVCDGLGKRLLVGEGPWGFGGFDKFVCGPAEDPPEQPTPTDWQLAIKDGRDALSLTLRPPKTVAPCATPTVISLPGTEQATTLLTMPDVMASTALMLLDAIPIGFAVSTDDPARGIVGKIPTGFNAELDDLPEPPETLALYEIRCDTKIGLWRSSMIAQTHRVKTWNTSTARLWPLPKAVKTSLEIYAHSPNGPGGLTASLKERIERQYDSLKEAPAPVIAVVASTVKKHSKALGDSVAKLAGRGYVGLRYGRQFLAGNPLLQGTQFFGLLAEVGAGRLKGLRYYYDKLFDRDLTVDGADGEPRMLSLGWSRHVLGRSFGLTMPLTHLRFELIPKLGIWSFKTVLPLSVNTAGLVVDTYQFEVKNVTSLALEAGTEMIYAEFKLRGWASIDAGVQLTGKKGNVSSRRGGVDFYYYGGPKFTFGKTRSTTAFLAFAMLESLSISQRDSVTAGSDTRQVDGITFSDGFVGGGVAFSWE